MMARDMGAFKQIIASVASGARLSIEQAYTAFDIMMSGDATPAQMGGFLMGLRVRGETVEEITGGAMAMREKAVRIKAPAGAIDTCGTGGDAKGTLNISTATALVVAACGVPVAKHGNRAQSSRSGAADVLAALGVNIEADMALVQQALNEAGICFLMAPRHHGAMRHVAGTRVELGTRTIFNLLGPLSNPAGAKRQLLGVFAREWIEPMARVLANLGSERVWVVHGDDGIDELSTTGPSFVAELKNGNVETFEVSPAEAGLPIATLDQLKGADPETNALAVSALLDGHEGPFRDIVLFNCAAAMIVAGKADDLTAGVALAASAIDSGAARNTLKRLVEITTREVAEE
jgi:anthranilate phosphoribosyltransferase